MQACVVQKEPPSLHPWKRVGGAFLVVQACRLACFPSHPVGHSDARGWRARAPSDARGRRARARGPPVDLYMGNISTFYPKKFNKEYITNKIIVKTTKG
jgi:hypothetical protein